MYQQNVFRRGRNETENAEHIRVIAFCWRCDEVEMRGTCLEAQKSIPTKVVINS